MKNLRSLRRTALVLSAAAMFLFSGTSCTSYKKTLYLQDDEVLNMVPQKGMLYDFRIMPKDELTIIISTSDPEASAPFYRKIGQSKENGNSSMLNSSNANLLNYLVDNEGYIDYPVLGMIKVLGLSTRECEALIREKLKPYLKEVPNVTVRTSNYKFSVLGEVNSPGTYTAENGKVNILEAMAMAGDMTYFSNRKDVQLLREDSIGRRYVVHLDLTASDIVLSPHYFIQQNDVIYVKSSKSKVQSNTFGTNTSMWLSLFGIITSLSTFILALSKL